MIAAAAAGPADTLTSPTHRSCVRRRPLAGGMKRNLELNRLD